MATNGKMKQWRVSYQWNTGPTQNTYKKRQIDVKSVYKPTRSVAKQFARLDLLRNVIGSRRDSYAYRSIRKIVTAETALPA
jgi:hypothetical protein